MAANQITVSIPIPEREVHLFLLKAGTEVSLGAADYPADFIEVIGQTGSHLRFVVGSFDGPAIAFSGKVTVEPHGTEIREIKNLRYRGLDVAFTPNLISMTLPTIEIEDALWALADVTDGQHSAAEEEAAWTVLKEAVKDDFVRNWNDSLGGLRVDQLPAQDREDLQSEYEELAENRSNLRDTELARYEFLRDYLHPPPPLYEAGLPVAPPQPLPAYPHPPLFAATVRTPAKTPSTIGTGLPPQYQSATTRFNQLCAEKTLGLENQYTKDQVQDWAKSLGLTGLSKATKREVCGAVAEALVRQQLAPASIVTRGPRVSATTSVAGVTGITGASAARTMATQTAGLEAAFKRQRVQ